MSTVTANKLKIKDIITVVLLALIMSWAISLRVPLTPPRVGSRKTCTSPIVCNSLITNK